MSLTIDPKSSGTDFLQGATKIASVDSSGSWDFPLTKKPLGRFYLSTSLTGQVGATNTTLDGVSFSRGITKSGAQIIPQVPGYYRVSWIFTCHLASGTVAVSYLMKNAAITGRSGQIVTATEGDYSLPGNNIVTLNGTTDYLQLQTYFTPAAQVYGDTAGALTHLELEWIGPL